MKKLVQILIKLVLKKCDKVKYQNFICIKNNLNTLIKSTEHLIREQKRNACRKKERFIQFNFEKLSSSVVKVINTEISSLENEIFLFSTRYHITTVFGTIKLFSLFRLRK